MATSGPGATNLITGVATAYANHVPMLVITGQPPLANFGRGALQESSCTGVNVVGMLRHCTRYNSLVSHPEQLQTKLLAALMRAHQSPQGPVHLSIPVDILRSKVSAPDLTLSALVGARPALVDHDAVRALQGELQRAERPVFLVGEGCAEAVDSIMRLVDLIGARFITTPDGKGLVNPAHHAWRGVFGFGRPCSAEALLREGPDLVVAFGTAFSELASAGWHPALMNSRLVHVADCEEHLMRSPMARLHVRGDLAAVCRALVQHCRPTTRRMCCACRQPTCPTRTWHCTRPSRWIRRPRR